jgi:hypothetical protein
MAEDTTNNGIGLDFGLVNQMMQMDIAFKQKMISMSDAITSFTDGLDQFKKTLSLSDADQIKVDKKNSIQEGMEGVAGGKNIFSSILSSFKLPDKPTKKTEDVFSKDVEAAPMILAGISPEALELLTGVFEKLNIQATPAAPSGGGGGGLLSSLFGGAKGGIGSMLMKALPKIPGALGAMATSPVTWILAGLVWAAVDAFRGAKMAEEWGVSKTAGALGGILGGMGSGITGAMKNMGKWAMIGAGIGLIGGPPGALLGGLIGGVIGAILGWIGGERISKAFQAVGDWFKGVWDAGVDNFKTGLKVIGNFISDLKEKVLSVFKFFSNLWMDIVSKIEGVFDSLGLGEHFDKIREFVIGVKDKFVDIYNKLKEMLFGLFKKLDPRSWFGGDDEEEAEAKRQAKEAKRQAKEEAKEAKRREKEESKNENILGSDVSDQVAETQSTITYPSVDTQSTESNDILNKNLEQSEKTNTIFNAGFDKLSGIQIENTKAIISAINGVRINNTSIVSSSFDKTAPVGRSETAYDGAYNMRSRYWTSYTRGL